MGIDMCSGSNSKQSWEPVLVRPLYCQAGSGESDPRNILRSSQKRQSETKLKTPNLNSIANTSIVAMGNAKL